MLPNVKVTPPAIPRPAATLRLRPTGASSAASAFIQGGNGFSPAQKYALGKQLARGGNSASSPGCPPVFIVLGGAEGGFLVAKDPFLMTFQFSRSGFAVACGVCPPWAR